jgi:hypothetical protein
MTPVQLKRTAESLRNIPIGILDEEEYLTLSGEFRNRNMIMDADDFSVFCETHHVSEPYRQTDTYRSLEQIDEKYKIYAAQAGELLILSPDPLKISKEDVVSVEHIDDGVKA